MRHRFVTLYGAGPGHLAVLLLSVAVAGYAASIVAGDPLWPWMAVWFIAAVVVHDGVLSPLAAAADTVLQAGLRRLPRARPTTVNYIRVPALGAALTFLMFLPGIIRQGEPVVVGQTGLDQSPFLGRWLLLVAAMAAVSALVYGGAPAHQTVSSRWLTASASSAWALSHRRGRGSSAHGTTSHTANGSQIRSTSALDSPVRSATTTAASAASTSSAAARGKRPRSGDRPADPRPDRRADRERERREVRPHEVGVGPARRDARGVDHADVAEPGEPPESGRGEGDDDGTPPPLRRAPPPAPARHRQDGGGQEQPQRQPVGEVERGAQ